VTPIVLDRRRRCGSTGRLGQLPALFTGTTGFGVLLIDVLDGMIIGFFASLLFVVYRSSRPHVSSVCRIPGARVRIQA
jgi:MFS superfamily sulfate permease-like transporter